MSINPSLPRQVMLVGRCHDPAIDLSAKGISEKLTRYERSRSEADRVAIPLRDGVRPELYRVAPLTAGAWRAAGAETIQSRREMLLVQIAVHEYTDPNGVAVKASAFGEVSSAGDFSIAADAWMDHLHERIGADGVAELAKVIDDWTRAGARAVDPFRLPRGQTLPR